MRPLAGERIRLFNVKFSPNLGDGLLAESLEKALHELGAAPDGTSSVDLAARQAYSPGAISRSVLLKALNSLPTPLRRAAIRVPLELLLSRRWRPHYEANLEDAQALVIGGGNLFSDMDLNFPSKLAAVLSIASKRRLPTAIYGVGVAGGWSTTGLAMMRRALFAARPQYVSVRDKASKERFDAMFADACKCEADVVRDPGILVSRYVEPVKDELEVRPVGLCVTSAISISYHSNLNATEAQLSDWYVALATRLAANDRPLLAFTNGSPEDEIFLDGIEARLAAAVQGKFSRSTVANPTELARLISGLDVLVAHRMHALIAGFSYGVPIFALAWDPKVDAFMDSIGLGEHIVPATDDNLERVANAVQDLAGARLPMHWDRRAEVLDQAFGDVGKLAGSLREAISRANDGKAA